MIELFAPLALMAQASPDCPTEETLAGRYRILSGETPCAEAEKRSLTGRPISAAEKRRIIAYFDGLLLDGPSARWKWGKVVNETTACFSINAKNRMGAYTGWELYFFDLKTGRGDNYEDAQYVANFFNTGSREPGPCD